RFGIRPHDKIFALSMLNFDLSVYDILGPLSIGAALYMPTGFEVESPSAWPEIIEQYGITVWNSVPQLMQICIDSVASNQNLLHSLKFILLSGDWISLRLPEQIRMVSPSATIYSLGGATEAAIWSIYHRITDVQDSWRSIPYGVP